MERRLSTTMLIYVAREFLVPLGCCVVGFLALFTLSGLLDVLRNLLDADLAWHRIAFFFLIQQMLHVIFILPMSVLLAASFAVSRMAKNGEIVAVRASGVSLVSWCLPIWGFAILLAGSTFLVNEAVGSKYPTEAETLLRQLAGEQNNSEVRQQHTWAYYDHRTRRHWFFDRFTQHGPKSGVLVMQYRPDQTLKWELRAEKVRYSNGEWRFSKARLTHYKRHKLLPQRGAEEHDTYAVEWQESPGRLVTGLRPAEELSFWQLGNLIFSQDLSGLTSSTKGSFRTAFYHRLTFPLSCLMAAVVGVGFAVSGGRASTLRGFAGSVGIIVLYYFVDQGLVALGRTGYLPGMIAGCSAPLLFTAAGILQLLKGR